ncbi:hypothetical protein P168DRAFT_187587 [Aspergillus campestris IBT 28561]|uniref:Uncharacterized protein n=1 Tax=Aspergillus campestris (strain IBT 28561) TaxID=1392248 RepID=A0A2I1CYB8_ASPC2|nr:uncharacterized protein P168DRAFT_187587 [Aspergillus campestris IBT 28561]PKY02618.1 hypothetical protein P168DRAFT_187587 [Aspergillus campestris IBT 28561]
MGSSVPSVIKSFRFAVAVHVDGLNASKKREKRKKEKKKKKTPEEKANAVTHTLRKEINVKAMIEAFGRKPRAGWKENRNAVS